MAPDLREPQSSQGQGQEKCHGRLGGSWVEMAPNSAWFYNTIWRCLRWRWCPAQVLTKAAVGKRGPGGEGRTWQEAFLAEETACLRARSQDMGGCKKRSYERLGARAGPHIRGPRSWVGGSSPQGLWGKMEGFPAERHGCWVWVQEPPRVLHAAE